MGSKPTGISASMGGKIMFELKIAKKLYDKLTEKTWVYPILNKKIENCHFRFTSFFDGVYVYFCEEFVKKNPYYLQRNEIAKKALKKGFHCKYCKSTIQPEKIWIKEKIKEWKQLYRKYKNNGL